MDEVRLFCDKHKPHVLSVNETWLDDSFLDDEVSFPGYNLTKRNRDSFGGGLAVYIAEHLQFKRLNCTDSMQINPRVEAIWLEITPTKSKKILVGSLYRPPNFDASTFTENLETMLTNLTRAGTETILMGDFNFDLTTVNYLNQT